MSWPVIAVEVTVTSHSRLQLQVGNVQAVCAGPGGKEWERVNAQGCAKDVAGRSVSKQSAFHAAPAALHFSV